MVNTMPENKSKMFSLLFLTLIRPKPANTASDGNKQYIVVLGSSPVKRMENKEIERKLSGTEIGAHFRLPLHANTAQMAKGQAGKVIQAMFFNSHGYWLIDKRENSFVLE